MSSLVTGAGQVPATADDIDFSVSEGHVRVRRDDLDSSRSRSRRSRSAPTSARVENVQTPEWRLPLGQIAANEAQHVGALAAAAGRPVVGRAFAPSLQIGAVSDALDAYES